MYGLLGEEVVYWTVDMLKKKLHSVPYLVVSFSDGCFLFEAFNFEAYSGGWKKAKSQGLDKSEWTAAGNTAREKCLNDLKRAGVPVAQNYGL